MLGVNRYKLYHIITQFNRMPLTMKTIHFLVEKTGTGFSAYSEAVGIVATGKTLQALERDAQDGLEGQCEVTGENPHAFTLEYTCDFSTLFEVFRLNVDSVADYVGINATLMSQYIHQKKTPSKKQKDRIEAGIHSYAKALSSFRFA